MKKFIYLFFVLFFASIIFSLLDWSVDGFDFFKIQNHKYYFQSWISIAVAIFVFIMSVTTYIIYKRSGLLSLKLISISFLIISFAYAIIGYHTSYCKVCSDLSLCGASHTYPNYFIVIALITLSVTVLLANIKQNVKLLKIFSYGLIISTILLMSVLFISIQFMETPDVAIYIYKNLNLQGFIFIFPLVLIVFSMLYFKTIYKLTNVTIFIFVLLFISFIPQAYHIFICTDCHSMECSEFFIFAGLLMFIAVGLLIYAISLQLDKKSLKK
ncbi:MAG: hypothetical protein U9R16_07170 [Campylobacterota bacterium]|nr:hypothetical protein [Campylobacterota bacterium]